MTDRSRNFDHSDDNNISCEVTDETLEAAANPTHPAMTLIGAPTVSILVACCSA